MSEPLDAEWVTVAVLGKTRGNRGEITAWPLSSKPERYQELEAVYLSGPEENRVAMPLPRFEVESTWFHQGTLVFKFRGVDSISDAERLSGCEVRLPISQRAPLDPGEFFQSDLVGCEVIDRPTGDSLGRVSEWLDSGGPGVLVVDEDLLIPFARAICVEIDPASRRIVVELPEGLRELNRPAGNQKSGQHQDVNQP